VSVAADLRAFLLADAGVTAIAADRVYSAPAPQDAKMPFVTYTRVTGDRVRSLTGPSGLAWPSYQIDCLSDDGQLGGSYSQATDLADAVRTALDGFIGKWSGLDVRISLLAELDTSEDLTRAIRVSQTYRIWHQEA
jgi:hypothetical protein